MGSVFDWIDAPTGQFGLCFFLAILLALIVSWIVRAGFKPSRIPGEANPKLSSYQVAYLVGGPHRVIRVVLANFAHRNLIRSPVNEFRIVPGTFPRFTQWPEVIGWESMVAGDVSPGCLNVRCHRPFGQLREELESLRLSPTAGQRCLSSLIPAAIAASPIISGLIRMTHRYHENRRIDLLVILCLFPIALAATQWLTPMFATGEAAKIVAGFRKKCPKWKAMTGETLSSLSHDQAGLAVALFNLRCLRLTRLFWIGDMFRPKSEGTFDGCEGGSHSYTDGGGGGSGDGGGHGGGGDAF